MTLPLYCPVCYAFDYVDTVGTDIEECRHCGSRFHRYRFKKED
jgi:ribosomal protein L37AE/L43A